LVALDTSAALQSPRIRVGRLAPFTLSGLVASAAGVLTLATIAAYGFSENGLRMGSQMAWRFAFFVYFAVLVAGPLSRVAPAGLSRFLSQNCKQLMWSFCAAFAVFLASLVVPNTIRPASIRHEGLDPAMMVFAGLGGALVLVMAYTAGADAQARLGAKAARAISSIGLVYFWLTYSLTALSHLYGPHRPDIFYGLCLSRMLLALLASFADCFLRNSQAAEG
jgi:hypothetical protein